MIIIPYTVEKGVRLDLESYNDAKIIYVANTLLRVHDTIASSIREMCLFNFRYAMLP